MIVDVYLFLYLDVMTSPVSKYPSLPEGYTNPFLHDLQLAVFSREGISMHVTAIQLTVTNIGKLNNSVTPKRP